MHGGNVEARPAWNDQRTDEFAKRTEENLREARGEIRNLRDEVRAIEESLRGEMSQHFGKLEDKLDRRSDIAVGAMITGFVGSIAAHFIA
jgi:hypothetical protein